MTHDLQSSWVSAVLNFSARTSENQTQDIIDGKLMKRRRGVYGPPIEHKLLVFVDDLNMPMKELYGAQPAIELLRQFMCQGGWYNRGENQFHRLDDVQFIAAMGPPGGGRTYITQRYVRHFNMINFLPFDAQSMKTVFGTIMEWFLSGYSNNIKSMKGKLVEASVRLYSMTERAMLPTPAKSHYTFNLRDLSGIIQGVTMVGEEHIQEPVQLIKLLGHECARVIRDRLVDAEDNAWFYRTTSSIISDVFAKDWNQITVAFFRAWMASGKPNIFNASAFFFVQSFLTGIRQNCARKHGIAIDLIDFDFDYLTVGAVIDGQPEEGAYVDGFYCIGSNFHKGKLTESEPKILHVPMPVVHLIPEENKNSSCSTNTGRRVDLTRHRYECPVYKTSERRGMLSTTGHSTNFIMYVDIPMQPQHTEKHWIKRGVALITLLDH